MPVDTVQSSVATTTLQHSTVAFHVPLNALYVILGTTLAANHLNNAKMGFTPNHSATQKPKQQLYKKAKHTDTKLTLIL